MLKHIVRIELDWLRIPLLCMWFPLHYLQRLVCMAMPVEWGGHPNKRRFFELDFYTFPVALFWAAWDGFFVPEVAR